MASEEDNGLHISPTSSPGLLLEEGDECKLCEEQFKQPKVLNCLHVFCQKCLENQLRNQPESELSSPQYIKCCVCGHQTTVPPKGIEDLFTDFVTVERLDSSSSENVQIVCTSCKAKEKAVARCSDCANYLCSNCVTAHQFMRCFENHTVVSFEDLQNGEALKMNRPVFCPVHPSDNLKFFCNTCQVPICNECMITEHKQPEHHHERIQDVELFQKEEIQGLVSECRSKLSYCEEASSNLGNALSELQIQRDNAKGLIQETFQSFKAFLEKRKDTLLEELEELHSKQELEIMDTCHSVEKTVEKIEDACKYTDQLIKHGNSAQILLMKKLISSQLLSLINNTPRPEVDFQIEFHTDPSVYEHVTQRSFGSFRKKDSIDKIDAPLSLQSSIESESFLPSGVLSPDNTILAPISTHEFMPLHHPSAAVCMHPTELPDFTTHPPMPTVPMGIAITGGTQVIRESNLSRNSLSPAMSDSGISVDTGSTNSNSSAHMINIAALAKLGNVGLMSQSQNSMNSQVGGLNMHNMPGLSQTSRSSTSMSNSDSSLSSLISTTPRATTPNLETLANLLNQPSSQLSGIGMGNMGHMGSLNIQTNTMGLANMNQSGDNLQSGPSSVSSGGYSASSSNPPYPPVRRGKMSAMQIRCKFGQLGPGKGQFNSPHGFCFGLDEDIIVADTNNHRIQIFEKTGEFKYQFGIPGKEEGQLWYPRKVAVMRNSGKFVVCDRGNERSRMQLFTKNGHFVKKIAIRYIDIVAGLAITQQGHIVAVDSVSPTVFVIAESGDLVKWFDCSEYMREPSDIAISGKEFFVCDFKGHCVVVFNENGQFLRRIGCENITNYPNGIDISDAGDVLVGDSHGNRFHVAVFQRDGSLIGEFECPYVKVSRCCGLKITSEGYIVTLAKNNHHVLILNTLYIT